VFARPTGTTAVRRRGRVERNKKMLEILKFIFSSFWVWLGVFLLVAVIAEGIGGVSNRYLGK
jgi:hypothetical protein